MACVFYFILGYNCVSQWFYISHYINLSNIHTHGVFSVVILPLNVIFMNLSLTRGRFTAFTAWSLKFTKTSPTILIFVKNFLGMKIDHIARKSHLCFHDRKRKLKNLMFHVFLLLFIYFLFCFQTLLLYDGRAGDFPKILVTM